MSDLATGGGGVEENSKRSGTTPVSEYSPGDNKSDQRKSNGPVTPVCDSDQRSPAHNIKTEHISDHQNSDGTGTPVPVVDQRSSTRSISREDMFSDHWAAQGPVTRTQWDKPQSPHRDNVDSKYWSKQPDHAGSRHA